jgi:hypothetical protein
MSSKILQMLAIGDIILGPDAESYFTFIKPVLKTGDVVVGQLEVPYTSRDSAAVNLDRDPENLKALVSAGINVVSLAGNHFADAGVAGIEDTIAWLRKHKIASVGGGMNIAEARRPVFIQGSGTRFGFLSYNCVGPRETWAAADKPGCAYVNIITHYELDHANPGGPPSIYTFAEPNSLKAMVDDIKNLRPLCDILTVSLHKGLVHTPIKLASYEQQVAYAAIDAGADLILGHHAHILHGIELYKGKAIFHSLCNGITWLPSLAPRPDQAPESWAKRRLDLFGFLPDPAYPTYPFHPEAKYTIIAKCVVEKRYVSQISYLPCLVNKRGKPQLMKNDKKGQQVFDYMEKITLGAGLNGKYRWEGNEILISAG